MLQESTAMLTLIVVPPRATKWGARASAPVKLTMFMDGATPTFSACAINGVGIGIPFGFRSWGIADEGYYKADAPAYYAKSKDGYTWK